MHRQPGAGDALGPACHGQVSDSLFAYMRQLCPCHASGHTLLSLNLLSLHALSRCRAVEVDGKAASLARAGDSADVTLAGLDATAFGSGSVVCHADFPVPLVAK